MAPASPQSSGTRPAGSKGSAASADPEASGKACATYAGEMIQFGQARIGPARCLSPARCLDEIEPVQGWLDSLAALGDMSDTGIDWALIGGHISLGGGRAPTNSA